MKDSGIEWIGEIPEDWDLLKLKNVIISLVSGATPDSSNENYYCDFELGIPWISIADMSNTDFIDKTNKSLTEDGVKSKNLTVLPVGTLIYSIYASLGNVSELNIEATTNQAILGMTINDEIIYKRYFKYWLKSIQSSLNLYMNSNTQNNLNASIVKSLPLVFPSIIEQQAIAIFLDQKVSEIDHILEKTRESIGEYKKYKQSLITEAVTKGLNPDVEIKNSGVAWIGEIPKHWGVGTIGRLFDYIGGYAFNSNNFSNEESSNQVLRIGNIRNDCIILDDKQVFVSDEIVKPIARFKIEYDDILFSMTGTKGKRDYFYTVRFGDNIINKNLFINQRVGCLRKRAKISPRYYNYLLKDIRILDSIFLYETGTANQGNLGIETIKRTKIQVPPYEEQQQISKFLSFKCTEIDSLVSQKEALLKDLETYKKSLIYECVTGKREVD